MSCNTQGCTKTAAIQCSRCKSVKYCGATCQREAWKTHASICSPLDDLKADAREKCKADRKPTGDEIAAIRQKFQGQSGTMFVYYWTTKFMPPVSFATYTGGYEYSKELSDVVSAMRFLIAEHSKYSADEAEASFKRDLAHKSADVSGRQYPRVVAPPETMDTLAATGEDSFYWKSKGCFRRVTLERCVVWVVLRDEATM